ncbi:TIGR03435 family protein [Granulicella sp. S156]|jgi:uncharacterized protein (TIGR03435 family)|uniref:TIGR03435 family protein n=1 Tax=Granulicella sp. S156 TaxID=1747224 RepID=UPI00131E400E|nr:TIGR03435 family protein [Granulicella sp. S156]
MKKMFLWIVAFATLVGSALRAQDITGAWQGTLTPPNGKELRIVLQLSKDDERLKAVMYSIDQGGQPFKASSAKFVDSTLKVELIIGSYEGKLSADGKTITGNWTQGTPLPLNLVRATKETAWEIPEPPKPPKLMAADADPSFDVATIKPNDSGATSLQQLTMNGRNFTIRNGSLVDLIAFAYEVQAKQIEGGPAWMDKDRYDIAAVPDKEGTPNPQQIRSMIRKLLADRFSLKFHHDKRELSAFVLTVGKNGQKLTPTQLNGPLPGLGFGPGKGGLSLRVINGTMVDFTGFLQSLVLDRPVVDQTGLTGKFDFTFTFTPDDSEFNGHPPQLPKQADDVEAAPGLFDAIQQQIGLKLDAKKTPVDVIVIDHVDKPSAN